MRTLTEWRDELLERSKPIVNLVKAVSALTSTLEALVDDYRRMGALLGLVLRNQQFHQNVIMEIAQTNGMIFRKIQEDALNTNLPDIDIASPPIDDTVGVAPKKIDPEVLRKPN